MLTPGTRLGPYEVISPIGEGGMGQVWKAHDTRLNRDVAIKVSAEQFSDRFQREAHAIAALNHPGICTLYDVGPDFLVMEYLEGSPLAGPLALPRALDVGRQILEALHAAHRKGITHRDLKPANILVTKQGVKLLDFGIASFGHEPDDQTMVTRPGVVVGTPAYMAPEQWQGRRADARSDIFAFGCVFYELLTGRKYAEERGVVEPAWVEAILQRCLEPDPDARWQSAHDVATALSLGASFAQQPPVRSRRLAAGWIAAGAFALVAAGLGVRQLSVRAVTEPAAVRFEVPPPEKTALGYVSISPDGRQLAFVAADAQGRSQLWLRPLDSLQARPLPGTDGASFSVNWSPDGRSVAFIVQRQLRKIRVDAGPAEVVGDIGMTAVQDVTWAPDGTILFAQNLGGLFRVPAAGGTPVPFTTLDPERKETRHYLPSMLPDGEHLLFVVTSPLPEVQGVWVISLKSPGERHRVLADVSRTQYADGHLLFARRDMLMAQPFDLRTLSVSGDPVSLGERVPVSGGTGFADFSVSATGVVAIGAAEPEMQMATFDRSGRSLGPFGAVARRYQFVRISPDQQRVAADATDVNGYQLFVFEPDRNTTTPLTAGAATGNFPVWSPDGSRMAFGSNRTGIYDIYVKASNGSSPDEPLVVNGNNKFLSDWSRDGRFVLYGESQKAGGRQNLWVLPMTGDRKPRVYLDEVNDIREGRFSPDGQWVAYTSRLPSGSQVFVASFPTPSVKLQISVTGGARPVWRDDGKELFFIGEMSQLMAVDINPGPPLRAGTPVALFRTDLFNTLVTFDAYRGGLRFVMPAFIRGDQSVRVILNWPSLVESH